MKAIIIDDEPDAIKTLEWEITKHCRELEIIGKYTNPKEGLEAIKRETPDVLFLDIQMPQLNGFDLLENLSVINFNIIFVTAYDEYAVKAFRINAVDYLLKPIITSDLLDAIKRVNVKSQLSNSSEIDNTWQIEKLKKNFNKIPLTDADGIEFVFPNHIIYCQSEGSYSYVILENKKVLITKSLGEMEEVLAEHNFIRTHRSFIVNLNHINKYVKNDGGFLVMSNGDQVAVSRRKKEDLMKLF